MFNPPNKNWTSDDAINLRTFLESETGARFLYHQSEAAPILLDGSDVNKTLVASGVVKGYNEYHSNMFSLTVEPPKSAAPEKSAYPDLDNDSEWQDTQTP